MKFMIFSPTYDNNSGGAIVLHYLCHLLNEMGHQAAIVPLYKTYESDQRFLFRGLVKSFGSKLRMLRKSFTVCPGLNTPVDKNPSYPLPNDVVAVYPEAVASNPLGAKNVVRWLLHRPGYHTGKVCYGVNELYFDYNAFSSDFGIPGSKLSKHKLFIAKYHDHLYNKKGALPPGSRIGTAYCIRKGQGKKIEHDLQNSILIDGLNHEEISTIFKRVKTFISYDTKTMYSPMALACGAESVVIPDTGVSKEEWEPNAVRSYGIAYGMDDLENARKTIPNALEQLDEFSVSSKQAVAEFTKEVKEYFEL
jgi:hypothetical protein